MSAETGRHVTRERVLPEEAGPRLRSALKWTVGVVLASCLLAIAWRAWIHTGASATAPIDASGAAQAAAPETSPPNLPGADSSEATGTAALNAGGSPRRSSPADSPGLAAPTPSDPAGSVEPAMENLVAGLMSLAGTNAVLTSEAAALWRTNLQQLVQAGSAAVPAIQAFLRQGTEHPFTREVWQTVGYTSPRLAALDALRQIGGPEATAAMEAMLGRTQAPNEIAVLARNLEEASPGQYRQQALETTRTALAAAAKATDPQLDVAPLFEVFQHYGDTSVIPDLEKAVGQWKYYATIALANLPDGAGVPSILRMADPASGSGDRVVALEMVAQLAASNPEARQFLTVQVANKSVPPNLWPYLASPLAGDQYFPVDSAITPYPQLQSWSDLKTTHIGYGNQNLYTLPGNQNLTAEGISRQLALVDELLQAASDPAALEALQQARNTLAQRSSRGLAQVQPAGEAAGQ